MNSSLFAMFLRWVFLAVGVTIATKVVPGISYQDNTTLLVVVVLLSFLNAVIRPILLLLTLPFILFTAGLGIVVINALLFMFVGNLVEGFYVAGFWPAFWGALIVGVTNVLFNALLGPRRRMAAPPRPPTPPPSAPGGKGGDVIDI